MSRQPIVKLKDSVEFEQLTGYGFQPDPANCENIDDHYYYGNNWFCQIHEEFRIVVNIVSRSVEIFSYSPDKHPLRNTDNISVIVGLVLDGLVEIWYPVEVT